MSKFTAVITNYNARDHLARILPQIRKLNFDQIIVLDDASSDGSREWLHQQHDIQVVEGEENLGPTGNRNRVLDLDTEEFLVFIDVDMELLDKRTLETLEQEFSKDAKTAVVAPLILSESNEPMWYNWGYDFSPKRDGVVDVLNELALVHGDDASVMATVRRLAEGNVGHLEKPSCREVDWVCEGFFAVKNDVFRRLDGFDPKFRMFHEGPDFCLRARAAGNTVWFTTNIVAKHLDLHSGSDVQRSDDMRVSSKYYFQKHYGVPADIAERFFIRSFVWRA
jgi:N-acetylglucosaminyl-diphospho-decaprenol L-rhamnosyltransferase